MPRGFASIPSAPSAARKAATAYASWSWVTQTRSRPRTCADMERTRSTTAPVASAMVTIAGTALALPWAAFDARTSTSRYTSVGSIARRSAEMVPARAVSSDTLPRRRMKADTSSGR